MAYHAISTGLITTKDLDIESRDLLRVSSVPGQLNFRLTVH